METTVASDLHKTIEYLQNQGVNVKVYKNQCTKGNENPSPPNMGEEKFGFLEKATQTDETLDVTVYKYQSSKATKGKENASSSNKGNEKLEGRAIQICTHTSKRKLAQRTRRERERLEGLSRYYPTTTGRLQPLTIAESGVERNITNLQETTGDVLPPTPECVNIIHGEESLKPTKGETEPRGIKRNIIDLHESTKDVLPQTSEGVTIIHGEESLKATKGETESRVIKRNITDLQEPTKDVLPHSSEGVTIIHGEEDIKGKENAKSLNKGEEKVESSEKETGKAMQTDNSTSKRKIAQRLRREREKLEARSHVVPVGVYSMLGEKVKQITPSRRVLAQRLRRERERLERSEQPEATK